MSKVKIMPRGERLNWLLIYVLEKGSSVDVLDAEFVDHYAEATKATLRFCAWGAHKCALLGEDLSLLKRQFKLKRGRVGLAGAWQPGFPTWVFCYSLTDLGKTCAEFERAKLESV